MAAMVLAVPGLTPAAWWDLSANERDALVDAVNERHRAGQAAMKKARRGR